MLCITAVPVTVTLTIREKRKEVISTVPTTDRVILWRGMEGLNVLEQVTLAKTIS